VFPNARTGLFYKRQDTLNLSLVTVENAKRAGVYLIHNGRGHMKIGWTTDLPARLTALQIGSADTLEVLRVLDGGQKTEKWLHKHYSQNQIRGEWFRSCPSMLTITPPDELPNLKRTTVRRDVRLTAREKARQNMRMASAAGCSPCESLHMILSGLGDEEATSITEEILRYLDSRENSEAA